MSNAKLGCIDRPRTTDSGRPASLAGEMLTAAAAIVDGARGHVNGEAERSFTAIAAMWTAYLQSRREPGGPVRPRDVPQMMALLKQQRAEWGIPERDHYVDGAGYFALSGEIALS